MRCTAPARSGISITVTPASASISAPRPSTKTDGSRQANTTRAIPAATISSAQLRWREARALHGSSEL
jgi:hypothetical protein